MNKKIVSNGKKRRFNPFILILPVFAIVMFFFDKRLGIIELLIALACILMHSHFEKQRARSFLSYVEDMFINMDSSATSAIIDLPIPMVIIDEDGTISWYNEFFKNLFDQEILFDINIATLIESFDINGYFNSKNRHFTKDLILGDKNFNMFGSIAERPNANGREIQKMAVIYMYDETDLVTLKKVYEEEKPVSVLLIIDNYEDLKKNSPDSAMPQIVAKIDSIVYDMCESCNASVKKFERDQYTIVMPAKSLEALKEKKFEILDEIRALDLGNKIPVTVSLGIGVNGDSYAKNDREARKAVDMALGRGGDQAVIKDGANYTYFGGKSQAYEKGTRVKARVVAQALTQLIGDSDQVFVMGHKNADIDSFGACLGIAKVAAAIGKETHIVLESYDYTVKEMIKRLGGSEEYEGIFITSAQAISRVDEKSVVIIVDTHNANRTECPDIISATDHIMIIDHHRRGAEFIENPQVVFHEPYASSASELVTELIQYVNHKIRLSKLDAEALYAGIRLDTHNFTFKTGVRTFDAASYLKKSGVDTISVEKLFQTDISMIANRNDIVNGAEFFNENIVISSVSYEIENSDTVIAQAADDMLKIQGIGASFVLAKSGPNVKVSARSLGDINVQIIAEKLGGGGHMTMSGAQIKNADIDEAISLVKNAINEYYDEQ